MPPPSRWISRARIATARAGAHAASPLTSGNACHSQGAQHQSPCRGFSSNLDPQVDQFPAWEPRNFFHFEVLHQSRRSRARVGRIHTQHGIIDTPGFVPVGTNAALKAVDHALADEAGMQLMFCNTYHLMLHPGADIVREAGGLHRFMRRNKPLITDSGGFQIFSMANQGALCFPGVDSRTRAYGDDEDDYPAAPDEPSLKSAARKRKDYVGAPGRVQVTEDGVKFRSYRDGSPVHLTPEVSVDAQKDLGADIIIPLDELPPFHTDPKALALSVARTHRWEARSLLRHLSNPKEQAMYAVLHGGLDWDLRAHSVEYLTTLPFDGWAVGGSLGRDKQDMLRVVDFVTQRLPQRGPRHLLGIADEESIRSAAPFGIDTFDSCYPTRLGRHGLLLTRKGLVKVKRAEYKSDFGQIDEECSGYVNRRYSLAYLHHLQKAYEPLGASLCALHNIQFMNDMCANLRSKILQDEI